MEKPDVESIEGLSPAISIDQKTTSKNPRSTVGTVTEIYDYLRLLYARTGIPYCPNCGRRIRKQSTDEIIEQIMSLEEGTKIMVMAPVIRGKKGEHQKVLQNALKEGFVRARVDSEIIDLSDELPALDKNKKHNIEIVVDRLVISEEVRSRLTESVELALHEANKLVLVGIVDGNEQLFSQNYSCPECGISIEELTPRMFSFNTPYGACEACTGLGELLRIDIDKIVPNKEKRLSDTTAILGWAGTTTDSISNMYIEGLCNHYGVNKDSKIKDLPKKFFDILFYGSGEEKIKFKHVTKSLTRDFEAPFEGIAKILERRFNETSSPGMKQFYSTFMTSMNCPECNRFKTKQNKFVCKIWKMEY